MSKSRTHICKRTTNYGWVIYIYASRRQFFKIHIFTFIYLKECEEKRGKITSKFLTSPEMKTTLLYERERAGAPSFSRPNQITPRLAHFPNRVFSSSVALKSPGIIPSQVSFRGTRDRFVTVPSTELQRISEGLIVLVLRRNWTLFFSDEVSLISII